MTPEVKKRIEQIRNGNVPEGYKKVKTRIIPQEWTYEVLAPYLIQHHEVSDYSNQYPVLTSSRKGIFLQSDYYNKEIASEDNTGYNVVPRGYFTYRHMSDDEVFRFNINTIVDKGIVSTLYPVFTTSERINDVFLRELLNGGSDFQRYAILQKQGGSRTYMYFDKLKKLTLPIPPLEEQSRIANILTVQDKVVELKEKLLTAKLQQKKYLMQQLLTGKKRLPGFDGEWRNVKLNEVLVERKEMNATQDHRICSVAVQKGVVDQIEHLGRSYAAADTSNYGVAHYGDIIYTKSPTGDFPYGIIKQSHMNENVAISPLYGVFEPTCFELGYLLHTYFSYAINCSNYLTPIIQKGAKNTINITNDVFVSKKLYLPMDKAEQKALAALFVEADNEIELLRQSIEQEKQKKKALMQLLLTGIVRVK